MRHRKIPILVHIDVEPDGLFIDPSTPLPWDGYARAHGFFAALRAQLTESSGAPAHFSWMFRMDPQIAHTYGAATWPIRQHRAYVEDHVEQGDEIGLHVHAYRWSPEHNGWTIDLGNPEWVGHCVCVAVEAYRQALGHDCQSFSFGDRWASDATFELLERLGVRFDLTVEPGRKEIPTNHPGHPYTGTLPSFVGIPQAPYHPSKTDFRVADPTRKDGIWIIPVSTGRSPYGRAADLYHRVRHPRHHTDVIKPLNLIHWPRTFLSIVNELLARLARPYLSIVLRVDAFQNARSLNHVKQNMAALQQHPRASEFIFVTQAEALHILGVGA